MTAIRPPVFPPSHPTTAPQRVDTAKLAAQKAFFEAALKRTAATPVPDAAAQPQAPVRTPQAVAPVTLGAAAENPQKILRPGSLLDIRV